MTKDKIKIGIMGFGTVGTGAYEILRKNEDALKKQIGAAIIVEKILVKDLNKKRAVFVPDELLTTNADDILENTEIDIVVELMGGVEPAYSYIIKALDNCKHIVTANKELLAKKGNAVFEIAD